MTDQTGRNPTGGLAIGLGGDIYLTTANKGSMDNGSIVQLSTTAAGPDQLTIAGLPGTGTAGQALGTIAVRAIGSNGQVDTSANGPVTLVVATGPGTPSTDSNGTPVVVNPLTVTSTLVNGVATFSNVTLTQAGQFTLRATDARRDVSQSGQFTVNPGAVNKLVFLQQPTGANQNRTWGQIIVAPEDQFGNLVTNTGVQITLTTTSGDPLSNATATSSRGLAIFNNVSTSSIKTLTLKATAGAIVNQSAQKVQVLATPSAMGFASVPTKAVVGNSFAIQVNVNHQGNVPVTLSLATKPGGANLFGTLTVMAVNGVATFNDLMLFTAGVYQFKATSPNLGTITSIKLNLITVGQANSKGA